MRLDPEILDAIEHLHDASTPQADQDDRALVCRRAACLLLLAMTDPELCRDLNAALLRLGLDPERN